jgi:DNA-binding Lrp family transcriptional regulator
VKTLKDTELRIISELMKNSHRSDRELAKALGVSQPTVTRHIQKLWKEGVIKEYTIVPDFAKLGYTLLAVTFVKLKADLSPEATENARKEAKEYLREQSPDIFMLERGIGQNFDGVLLSLHRNYSDYLDLKQRLRNFEFLNISEIGRFIVNLEDEIHYRPLTFSFLAKHVLQAGEEVKTEKRKGS